MNLYTSICSCLISGKNAFKTQIKTIGKDIIGVYHAPVDIYKGWKVGGRVAKANKQSIFTGIKTRGVGAIRKGVAPHLPGLTAASTCWIPCPGSTESGYIIGRWLRKAITSGLKNKV